MSFQTVRRLLERDEIEPNSHSDEEDFLDFIHSQQSRVQGCGSCFGGCKRSNLIRAWSFALDSKVRKAGHKSGMTTVCKFSRLPCPTFKLGSLIELYSKLNNRNA